MNDLAKQILVETNQPLIDNLKNQFVSYLSDIDQKSLIEWANKIDWINFTKLFEVEYAKVWGRMSVPQFIDGLKTLKKEYELIVLDNFKQIVFHLIYRHLISLHKDNELNEANIDGAIRELYNSVINDFFKIFDYQFTLVSLCKNTDKKLINKKIEELRKRTGSRDKILTLQQLPVENKIFNKIDEELERREKIGQKWSIRAVCDYIGRNELGYGQDVTNQSELNDFYKRYLEYYSKK